MASFYGVSGRNLQYQYKDFLSDFKVWDQISHAKKWLLFPQNIGKRLSIDETSLSNGELYTILTNKSGKGRKGTIIAMIAGTKAETVIGVIEKIALKQRNVVKEITRDMAGNMGLIAKRCFPNATRVTDRFHVQKLASEALQEIRIKHRWEAIDQENDAIEKAKKLKVNFEAIILSNGDTLKQLLARSRYFLYKTKSKWTQNQAERAVLLFELYPHIQKGYNLTQELRNIFENTKDKIIGFAKLAKWHEKVNQSGFKSFGTISRTIMSHYQTILNYFDNRSTNASAESFNAKIKAFRSKFRGVRNIEYFLFRLTNIYA
ncbi:transposase [Flavobacterium sp. Fl-318]|uniref:Transposase n=1 Tax=Flavobacterium cupriresistens TaxID=2893885 RepID=A0ABU4RHE7_9FLAO|nr:MULTISPECIES: transposase [unclassified Flavobacterium]MDX6192014.1 transposase [Flavobacterium sp. Fl-318]UFH44985.1 transposase [Flavobacterium sp. F-323]